MMRGGDLLWIWAGGALGSLARYVLLDVLGTAVNGGFPWGTAAANVSGSLLIGVVLGLIERGAFGVNTRLFLAVGVLGGYTTFSFFSHENLALIRDGAYFTLLVSAGGQVGLGLLAVYVGWWLSHGNPRRS
jgi:fluoride exporter